MKIPRLVLAGSSSGVGKTSISCGLIMALKKSGHTVQPFKVGPDYIDPSYLSSISSRPTVNLDVWLMGKKGTLDSFVQHSTCDISLIEGVMGYYDGFSGDSNHSSTHHVATILKSPVILVLDASRAARSVAATALGFVKFHKNSQIRGIILNKLGSHKHEILCRQALESLKIPIVGCIPRLDENLESRHLGLIPTTESHAHKQKITKVAKAISQYIDTKKLVQICNNVQSLPKPPIQKTRSQNTVIAIALDSSFNFYYHDNIENLRQAGAKIKFFSPISDKTLPKCDGLYMGGGFPEVQSSLLSKNHTMKKAIKKFAEDQKPLYAECGGLMYLTSTITNKKTHKMVGLFSGDTIMTSKPKLNYTDAISAHDSIMFKKGRSFHGHEFHYSKITNIPRDARFAYDLSIGEGIIHHKDGLLVHNTLASYGHLYFGQAGAKRLVDSSIKLSRR